MLKSMTNNIIYIYYIYFLNTVINTSINVSILLSLYFSDLSINYCLDFFGILNVINILYFTSHIEFLSFYN